ncbi:MAG TPA: hypothetical protein VJW16_03035 [Lysobacter sp.]|nr:hypothetical protein [Lysobacter sp.]
MDERQLKQRDVTRTLLAAAALEVQDAPGHRIYREHVAQNELELALNCLQEIGDGNEVSADYWWNLKKAAEVMGLKSRYAALRIQRLKVLKSRVPD